MRERESERERIFFIEFNIFSDERLREGRTRVPVINV